VFLIIIILRSQRWLHVLLQGCLNISWNIFLIIELLVIRLDEVFLNFILYKRPISGNVNRPRFAPRTGSRAYIKVRWHPLAHLQTISTLPIHTYYVTLILLLLVVEWVLDVVLSHSIYNVVELSHLWHIEAWWYLIHLLNTCTWRLHFFWNGNFKIHCLIGLVEWFIRTIISGWLTGSFSLFSIRIKYHLFLCHDTKVVSL